MFEGVHVSREYAKKYLSNVTQLQNISKKKSVGYFNVVS